jgi:hypothetical protein
LARSAGAVAASLRHAAPGVPDANVGPVVGAAGCAVSGTTGKKRRRRRKKVKTTTEVVASARPEPMSFEPSELDDEWADGACPLVASQVSRAPRALARGASDEAAQPLPKLARGSGSSSHCSRTTGPALPEGTDVVLQGLASRVDLDKQLGTVESFDAEAQRYAIRIGSTGERVRVKEQNLRRFFFASWQLEITPCRFALRWRVLFHWCHRALSGWCSSMLASTWLIMGFAALSSFLHMYSRICQHAAAAE